MTVKDSSTVLVVNFTDNPANFIKLEKPQKVKNMVVVPIILKSFYRDFLTISQAQEEGVAEILETGTVSQLKVNNKGNKPILIPFGITVTGGKQDRTIYEPILIPAAKQSNPKPKKPREITKGFEINIPSRCVEQGRWSPRALETGRNFSSGRANLPQSVAFHALSTGPESQSSIWAGVEGLRENLEVSRDKAPTSSYLDIAKAKEEEIEEYLGKFKKVDGQCGIAVLLDEKLIAMEFYSSPNAWADLHEEVLRPFIIEMMTSKSKGAKEKHRYHDDQVLDALKNIDFKFESKSGLGLGNVVKFITEDNQWRGITLIHQDTFIQFYLISRRESKPSKPTRFGFTRQPLPPLELTRQVFSGQIPPELEPTYEE